ncbi:unnamed protein product [Ilex paraguariensis]|uniref:Uncharacterized protein n=1 Tax=Ilex paraguariensis TaxID=185542 RepID=A0ABC8RX26_9AQUA
MAEKKEEITQLMGITKLTHTATYLRMPSFCGKTKMATFNYVLERIMKKIQGWKNIFQSQEGNVEKRKICSKSWKDMTMAKALKGPGFKDFSCFNPTLLAKTSLEIDPQSKLSVGTNYES